jgi:hypothetical protein
VTIDTAVLRTRARNLAEMNLPGSSGALTDAATEIDTLRSALAAVPHAELCRLLMTRDDEPCSCEKSALGDTAPAPSLDPLVLIPDATTVTYLGVTRLDVHGPAGRLVGVLGVTGVHVEQQDDGRRLVVIFEQGTTT